MRDERRGFRFGPGAASRICNATACITRATSRGRHSPGRAGHPAGRPCGEGRGSRSRSPSHQGVVDAARVIEPDRRRANGLSWRWVTRIGARRRIARTCRSPRRRGCGPAGQLLRNSRIAYVWWLAEREHDVNPEVSRARRAWRARIGSRIANVTASRRAVARLRPLGAVVRTLRTPAGLRYRRIQGRRG